MLLDKYVAHGHYLYSFLLSCDESRYVELLYGLWINELPPCKRTVEICHVRMTNLGFLNQTVPEFSDQGLYLVVSEQISRESSGVQLLTHIRFELMHQKSDLNISIRSKRCCLPGALRVQNPHI